MRIQCNHCDNSTSLTEAGARSVGWRIFQGVLYGGDPWEDVACPNCSGRSTAIKTWATKVMEQDALFPVEIPLDEHVPPYAEVEIKLSTMTGTRSAKDIENETLRNHLFTQLRPWCLVEIADGLESAADYAGGPKSNSGRTMLHYARRIRELLVGDHESCDSHD